MRPITRAEKETLMGLILIIFTTFLAGAMVDELLSAIHPNLPIIIPILSLSLYYYLQWRLSK